MEGKRTMSHPTGEPERLPTIETRLLRTDDLIDVRLEARGCTLEPTDDGAVLLAGPDAALIVHFPPQHLGERAWQVQPPETPTITEHIAAGPTHITYELGEGTRIPFTLEAILAALPELRLRVAPTATPLGQTITQEPKPPADDETAIEAPYHLVVSPADDTRFGHSAVPLGPPARFELWRTHLARNPAAGPAPLTVRAIWNRDNDEQPPGFTQSLDSTNRDNIVKQTHGGDPANADTPLMVANLALSSLSAWFDWQQSWEFPNNILDYRHQAFMGRDGYVRVVYPGFFFPFGHRCYLVQLTERSIRDRAKPVAHLWQRFFIVLKEPTRRYRDEDRDNPFTSVTISPLVTPDLDTPAEYGGPFIPTRNNAPFPFTLTTTDRDGKVRAWSAPLVFVRVGQEQGNIHFPGPGDPRQLYTAINRIPGRGQSLAMATPGAPGDTSVEVTHLVFDGELDTTAVTARPFLQELNAVVPAMRQLTPQAPPVDLRYAVTYLKEGLPNRRRDQPPAAGHPNADELLLALKSPPPAIDFTSGSDRSGGFINPTVSVKGLSRLLGAVGDDGAAPSPAVLGIFDPATPFQDAAPKLFGVFNLLELLDKGTLRDAPAFVSDALDAITQLTRQAELLRAALEDTGKRLEREVITAAHGGAATIAKSARDAVQGKAGPVLATLETLLGRVPGLPGSAGSLAAAITTLAGQLDDLRDQLAAPGIPAAVRSDLGTPIEALRALATAADTAEGVLKLLDGLASGQISARMTWRPHSIPGARGRPRTFSNLSGPMRRTRCDSTSRSAPPRRRRRWWTSWPRSSTSTSTSSETSRPA